MDPVTEGTPIPPPPGVDITADQSYRVIIADVVTFSVAILAFMLRIIARRCGKAGFSWDDYLMIPPVALSIFSFVSPFIGASFGKHLWAVGYQGQVKALEILFADLVIYMVNLFFLKLSILALYWRIFHGSRYRWIILASVIPICAWFITSTVMAGLECTPISKFWDILQQGNCVVPGSFWLGSAVVHVATDFYLLVLPIPFIFGMRTTWSQKFLITGSFLLGSLCLVFTPLRLHYLTAMPNSPDLLWYYTDSVIWATVENNISIVAVCMPTLLPIYRYLTTGTFHNQSNTQHKRGSSLAVLWNQGDSSKGITTGAQSTMRNTTVGDDEKMPGGVLHLQGLSHRADSEADEKECASTSVVPIIHEPTLEDVDLSSDTEETGGSESSRDMVRHEIKQPGLFAEEDMQLPIENPDRYTIHSYSEMETGQMPFDRDSSSLTYREPEPIHEPEPVVDRSKLTPRYEIEHNDIPVRNSSRFKMPIRSPSRGRTTARSPARAPVEGAMF